MPSTLPYWLNYGASLVSSSIESCNWARRIVVNGVYRKMIGRISCTKKQRQSSARSTQPYAMNALSSARTASPFIVPVHTKVRKRAGRSSMLSQSAVGQTAFISRLVPATRASSTMNLTKKTKKKSMRLTASSPI
jgi:hypothetical protein